MGRKEIEERAFLVNNKQSLLLGIFLLYLTMSVYAGGNVDNTEKNENVVVNEIVIASENTAIVIQVTGTVRLIGSSRFSELVITGTEYQWYIANEDRDKLNDLQHHTVIVEGEEIIRERRFANGQPAGVRRELRNIKIIEVEPYY